MLPRHTAVKVDDPNDDMHGKTIFIHKTAGETADSTNEEIPDGWCECVWEPSPMNIEYELYRTSSLVLCGC